jgi:hypothetical protein
MDVSLMVALGRTRLSHRPWHLPVTVRRTVTSTPFPRLRRLQVERETRACTPTCRRTGWNCLEKPLGGWRRRFNSLSRLCIDTRCIPRVEAVLYRHTRFSVVRFNGCWSMMRFVVLLDQLGLRANWSDDLGQGRPEGRHGIRASSRSTARRWRSRLHRRCPTRAVVRLGTRSSQSR